MILRLLNFNQTLNNGKIEHIGIAVKDLVSNLIFEKFWAPAYKSEEVESEGVSTSFFFEVD
jgi:hypothetical protein